MTSATRSVAIYLIGFPGVGKYTIAKELVKQSDFILVDNHLINNPIFSLVRPDGVTPLPKATWDYVMRIRKVVLDAIENLAPRDASFVFTNFVTQSESDQKVFAEAQEMFSRRGTMMVPVFLSCDLEEHRKRIVSDDRRHRLKEIDPNSPERNRTKNHLIDLSHPHRLDLDVTTISPQEAATRILEHARKLMPNYTFGGPKP